MLKYGICMLFFIDLCTLFQGYKNALTVLIVYIIKNKILLFTRIFFRDKISLVRKRIMSGKVEALYEGE